MLPACICRSQPRGMTINWSKTPKDSSQLKRQMSGIAALLNRRPTRGKRLASLAALQPLANRAQGVCFIFFRRLLYRLQHDGELCRIGAFQLFHDNGLRWKFWRLCSFCNSYSFHDPCPEYLPATPPTDFVQNCCGSPPVGTELNFALHASRRLHVS